jgi:penicillin-binding protein 2
MQKEFYSAKAYSNVTKEIKISPQRGIIYDSDGKVIAGNRALYELVIIPEKVYGYKKNKKDSLNKLFDDLENLIKLDRVKLVEKILNSKSFKEVILSSDLNKTQLSKLTTNLKYIDGVFISAKYVRDYPYKDLYFSYLGYVARINKQELNTYSYLNILPNDFMGRIGLEKEYNDVLYGKVGSEKVVINAYGKIIDRKKSIKPQNGKDIHMSIDTDLQQIAYEELKGKKGAIVASNIETGEILAFYSNPTYDANKFIKGISRKEYNANFKKDSPLFNRVIQGQYPPASTVKPFVGLAAMQGNFIEADEIVTCGPYYKIGKAKFRDWKRWGHGKIDMVQAIARSSDVYFYKIAHKMGIDYMHDFLSYFDYGKKLDIPFDNQKSGILPSNAWKMKTQNEPFYAGDTVIVGIGQGSFLATPIQMLNSVMILANNGQKIKMQFEKNSKRLVTDTININNEFVKIAKNGMKEVMHGKFGSARSVGRKLDFKMGGKTGTAQVFSTKGEIEYENDEIPEHLRDHAMFVGYAPFDSPKIAISVIVEHGKSGSGTAAPIAAKIISKYLEKHDLIPKEEIEVIEVKEEVKQ